MNRFDPKKFAKRTRQEKLAADNERINNDNLKLRELVVNLAKANMELGGTGEGSKGSKGEEVSTLQQGIENDQLAVQGACGAMPVLEDNKAEGRESKEGVA